MHQRAGVPGELDLAGGEQPRRLEIPCLGGDRAAGPVAKQPEYPADVLEADVQVAHGVQRLIQHGRRGFVAVDEPGGERVEYEIDSPGRHPGRRRGPGGFGRRLELGSRPQGGRERLQVRFPHPVRVERGEPYGRAQQEPRRVAAVPPVERDLPAQVLDLGSAPDVRRPGLDRVEEPKRRIERTGVALDRGRREFPVRTPLRFGREHSCLFEERRSRDETAAGASAARGAFEFGCHVFVG